MKVNFKQHLIVFVEFVRALMSVFPIVCLYVEFQLLPGNLYVLHGVFVVVVTAAAVIDYQQLVMWVGNRVSTI